MTIRVVRPKLPEFKGAIKKEEWGSWMKLSPFHDPVFIPRTDDIPAMPRGGIRRA